MIASADMLTVYPVPEGADLIGPHTVAILRYSAGYNEDRKIKNVVFENLVINGTVISDDMEKPGWYKTSDMARIFVGEHVEGVEFRSDAQQSDEQ